MYLQSNVGGVPTAVDRSHYVITAAERPSPDLSVPKDGPRVLVAQHMCEAVVLIRRHLWREEASATACHVITERSVREEPG